MRFEATPNPNAMKLVLPQGARLPNPTTPAPAPRSYSSPDAAANDPVARALFEIPGVVNVLLSPTFITLGRADNVAWTSITDPALALLTHALKAHTHSVHA